MALLTEVAYPGDWLKAEGRNLYSRQEITVKTGTSLASGLVVGFEDAGTVSGVADAGNTGDGTIGTLSAGTGAQVGAYRVVFIEEATNLGTFFVEDPDGVEIGQGVAATEFSGEVVFTIADGATDWVAGDAFTVTVAEAATVVVVASPLTSATGSDAAVGILLEAVNATAAATPGVIVVRDAIVNESELTYDATIDDAAKRAGKIAQLLALGIVSREGA